MTTLTHDQAVAFGQDLAARHHATVLTHDSPGIALALSLYRALASLIPSPVTAAAEGAAAPLQHVSVTFPAPFAGTLIVLSPVAVSDPVTYAEVVAHEVHHAHQIEEVGGAQMAVDYLGSGELRATREAQAYLVGLWVRFLLTGLLPSVEDAMAVLGSGLYHLDAGELELARGVVTSGLETIRGGLCPPYLVALEALQWIRKHAPAAHVIPVAVPS